MQEFPENKNPMSGDSDRPHEPVEPAKGPGSKNRLFPFFLNRNRYFVVVGLFVIAGLIGGYAYYTFVGCKSGTCSITSNPTLSIIWGGVMGYLLPDFFFKKKQ